MKTFKKYLLTVGLALGTLVSGTALAGFHVRVLYSESEVAQFCAYHNCITVTSLPNGSFNVKYEGDDGEGGPEPEIE